MLYQVFVCVCIVFVSVHVYLSLSLSLFVCVYRDLPCVCQRVVSGFRVPLPPGRQVVNSEVMLLLPEQAWRLAATHRTEY